MGYPHQTRGLLPAKNLHQSIDPGSVIQFRCAQQQMMIELRPEVPEIVATDDCRRAELLVDLLRRNRSFHDKFVEERIRESEFVAIDRGELIGQIMRVGVAALANLPEALWTKTRHVNRRRGRHQTLVRADIARRLLAANVLLSGL